MIMVSRGGSSCSARGPSSSTSPATRGWASSGRARPRSPSRCSTSAAAGSTTASTTAHPCCGTRGPGASARPSSPAPGPHGGSRRLGAQRVPGRAIEIRARGCWTRRCCRFRAVRASPTRVARRVWVSDPLPGTACGDDLDKWGGGRFDVVSWDPRGTNASTQGALLSQPAERGAASGRARRSPPPAAASERYRRKTAALARRCGKVSGWLLPHISTADTARDLDHLRVLRRRAQAHLRRPLLRHLHRPDLRQPVPRPGPGDAARRGRRSGPRTRRAPRRRSPAPCSAPTRSSTRFLVAVRGRGTGALRARRRRPDRGRSASSGCSRG